MVFKKYFKKTYDYVMWEFLDNGVGAHDVQCWTTT